MKAVDTNIIVRLVAHDDPKQYALADQALGQSVLVPITVLLETAWVLETRYAMKRRAIAGVLRDIVDLPTVNVDQADLIGWALDRFQGGADFGDMLHLVSARESEAFVTFDKALSKQAGNGAPLPIETLKA